MTGAPPVTQAAEEAGEAAALRGQLAAARVRGVRAGERGGGGGRPPTVGRVRPRPRRTVRERGAPANIVLLSAGRGRQVEAVPAAEMPAADALFPPHDDGAGADDGRGWGRGRKRATPPYTSPLVACGESRRKSTWGRVRATE